VIAVQTTLQLLLEMGIEPQFVTSLDYHDICTRFFEKLPKDLHTELVAEPKATNAVFDLHTGPLSLLGNDLAETMLAEMKLNKGQAAQRRDGGAPGVLRGRALRVRSDHFHRAGSGISDGMCYAPGTSYEDVWKPELSRFCTLEMKQWEQIVRDRNILRKTVDHQGRPTYTEERLFTYLQQFERDFAKSSARIIDATEGGVLKRGTIRMTFAEAIEKFCTREIAVNAPAHGGMNFARTERVRDEPPQSARRRHPHRADRPRDDAASGGDS
jgi:hypothetical protein